MQCCRLSISDIKSDKHNVTFLGGFAGEAMVMIGVVVVEVVVN